MTTVANPNLPRQDAFAFLNELLAMGHFSSRNDIQEAMQMLQDHLNITPLDAQTLFIEWMKIHGKLKGLSEKGGHGGHKVLTLIALTI